MFSLAKILGSVACGSALDLTPSLTDVISGTGPVYQGRCELFPVQTDEHFRTVAR